MLFRSKTMRQANYSAWNRYSAWCADCDQIVGNPYYHFVLDPENGLLYQLSPQTRENVPDHQITPPSVFPVSESGIGCWPLAPQEHPSFPDEKFGQCQWGGTVSATPILGLPIKPMALFWSEGFLWMIDDSGKKLYSLDPITLECKMEVEDLPNPIFWHYKSANYRWNYTAPYITASSIFCGSEDYLWRLDRKTGEFQELYDGDNHIQSFGSDRAWISSDRSGIWMNVSSRHFIVHEDGSIIPLQEYPEIAPLLPIIEEFLSLRLNRLNLNEPTDTKNIKMNWEDHICFIDFAQKKLYFAVNTPIYRSNVTSCCNNVLNFGSNNSEQQQIYELTFGATDIDDVQLLFLSPSRHFLSYQAGDLPYFFDGVNLAVSLDDEWRFFPHSTHNLSQCFPCLDPFHLRFFEPCRLRDSLDLNSYWGEVKIPVTKCYNVGKTTSPYFTEYGARSGGLLGDTLYLRHGLDMYRYRLAMYGGMPDPILKIEKINFLKTD